MSRTIYSRVNWYDGQEVDETDLEVEQSAWYNTLASHSDFRSGSGVEQEYSTQRVLFDSYDVPASITALITAENIDGEPIYATDTNGLTVFTQPTDSSEGNQLEVELSDALLIGTPTTKVYIFGTTFGGGFVQECLTFEQNESQITEYYFTTIIAIMTQDFRGNQNTLIDGTACQNRGGRLRILESLSMAVTRDTIMVSQAVEPNMDYRNFKPAALSDTLDTLLDEIATSAGLNEDDLNINVTATTTRTLPLNDSTGLIVGQKFKATTNNIQKVTILLSVEEDTSALSGQEYNWSGDLVVGIRKLQTTTQCPSDVVPGTAIEFDPELSSIAEISFDQDGLEDLGISLDDTPQEVDFVFAQSLLGNPNLSPVIEVGAYYILTIRRSGDLSTGNIILQEAANTTPTTETDEMYMSVFSQNIWTDITESDLWFKVWTDAIRITDGTAIDDGVQITSPRTKKNASSGLDESYINGNYSLIDVSRTAKNYVMVQKTTSLTDSEPHPATGNPISSRVEDAVDVEVVSESSLTTLINAENNPVVLGYATDTNPIDNPQITGTTLFPGLLRATTFTIIQPTADISLNNLVGSILVPNITEPELKYRITQVVVYSDAYGDINNDTNIDTNDVTRCQALDGYSKDLATGSTVASVDQRNAILEGTVTMEEIIRSDVNNDGIVDISDTQMIQQNISLGTAFTAGSNFNRAVITVEALTNPLTTSINMATADTSFNAVPFSNINWRIDPISLWSSANMSIVDLRRFVPKTFTDFVSTDITESTPNGGNTKAFIPGDLILGGDIVDTAGNNYKVDLEIVPIVIDLPEGATNGEINIFSEFIRDQMVFYDGTYVSSTALANNQVRVSTSIMSHVKDIDGYDIDMDNSTADQSIAVLYTQSSGLLRVRANNIVYYTTRPELRTKIVLTVYLKKAGFRNSQTDVSSSTFEDLITAI